MTCDRCGRDVIAGVPTPCYRCREIAAAWSGDRVADDVMPCGCNSGSCYCDGDVPMLDPDFDVTSAPDYGHATALLAILAAHDDATNQPKGA